MANPFYVEPANPFQSLMAGVSGYDRMRKIADADDKKDSRQNAFQKFLAGDVKGAMAESIRVGDADLTKSIAAFSENQENRAFRQTESERAQRNADRTFGLQNAQLKAMLEGQRVPAGFKRNPDGSVSPIPGGPADPGYLGQVNDAKRTGEIFENEQKLRKEFEASAKPYHEVRRGYNRIMASKDDAAGDISLIFGFMKMLDPGSVVREGEFATAQNSGGIPDQVRNLYNRAMSGERLNIDQRNMFKAQAGSLYERAKSEYTAREKQMRSIASQFSLSPDRIIPAIGDDPTADPSSTLPAPPPGFEWVR